MCGCSNLKRSKSLLTSRVAKQQLAINMSVSTLKAPQTTSFENDPVVIQAIANFIRRAEETGQIVKDISIPPWNEMATANEHCILTHTWGVTSLFL